MEGFWRIELLGGMRLVRGTQVIPRCRTQQAASLLARLALYPSRSHAREELVELLWPDAEPAAARNNFKQRLSTLRRQLEPPGVPFGGVLLADRLYVRLNHDTVTVDVAEFEAAMARASQSEDALVKVSHLERAVQFYRGELLPGFYEPWILNERTRLAEVHLSVLSALTHALHQAGQLESALDAAQRAIAADPLRENSYADAIRLQFALGNPAAALRQYRKLENALREELGAAPSPEVRRLLSEPIPKIRAMKTHAAPAIQSTTPPPVLSPPSISQAAATQQASPSVTPRLPVQLTPFFGRVHDLECLTDWLRPPVARESLHYSSCLVTVTGIGGTGKTRIAMETARQLASAYRGAVWFVPLVDLTTAVRIPDAIAEALCLPPSPSATPLNRCAEFLSVQPSLLVLDNMEQVAEAAAPLVRELMERAPGLALLITSRQPLNLAGEREFPLAPMPVPELLGTPEALMGYESVQVFVNRAQAVRPDFQVTPRNAAAIAQLCRRLEGIPLALELAASRARVLTPAQMLTQLEKRLDFLVSRRHDITERHRTLRATMEWSYRLLPLELQPFFTRLSIFRGGWSLEAAKAVSDEARALDFLEQLRERSLILTDEGEEGMRFSMLETLREYAEEQRFAMLKPIQQLAEEKLSLVDRAEISRRHAAYFASLAENANPHLNGPDAALWCSRLKSDYDNLCAALNFCLQSAEGGEATLQFVANLRQFWWLRGPLLDGRNYLNNALTRPDSQFPSKIRAHALNGIAVIAYMQGDVTEAKRYYEQCLEIHRALNDSAGISAVLSNLGNLLRAEGEYVRAKVLYDEALTLDRKHDDRRSEAITLLSLGNLAMVQGERKQARDYYADCLNMEEEIQDQKTLAMCLTNLSAVAISDGEYRVARAYSERSLRIQRALGNQQGVLLTLSHLGGILTELGEQAEGKAAFTECLILCRTLGRKAITLDALEAYAVSACRASRPRTTVRLLSAATTLRDKFGFSGSPNSRSAIERIGAELKTEMESAAFSTLWEEGARLGLDHALDLALEDC